MGTQPLKKENRPLKN